MYTYISVLACGACTGVYYQVKMEYVKRLVWLHNPDPGKYWCLTQFQYWVLSIKATTDGVV